jgi:hypothetical protein
MKKVRWEQTPNNNNTQNNAEWRIKLKSEKIYIS